MANSKPDTKKDMEIYKLKQKGLSFRQIGRVVGRDVKRVYVAFTRAKKALESYPQH